MAGQKRTRNGVPKPQSVANTPQPLDTTMTDAPPCAQAQAQAHSSAPSASESNAQESKTRNSHTKQPSTGKPNTKRPRLPPNTTLTKRPLHHPALPSPFAASTSPKTLYITASSPFIPTCKRIRSLLSHAQKRITQSTSDVRGRGRGRLEANGRLEARDVESHIVEASRNTGGNKAGAAAGEHVYLKATGRAIPRALEVGVAFQKDGEFSVRVDMGNVRAVDDVEVIGDAGVGEGGEEGKGDGDGDGDEEEEEVPETRIRTLSTVTVCIGLK